ncbi:MAG: thiosulfate oxidation carrier protein SoxY [Pseudomonadota bacterium]
MRLNRREALMAGFGAAAAAALPVTFATQAMAATAVDEAIAAFTGGAEVKEGGVTLTTPEIAENGNTVPIEIDAGDATDVLILADGNPSPGVATFHFGALAVGTASTRVRLATTQNVIAVAKLADGSFGKVERAVKVTIGGCGG